MLKIGEFSKLSRVSIRMLRYCDAIGLLKPAETDRFTDYRYYSEAQLPVVCRITALRDMGFPLADVRALLPVYGDSRTARMRVLAPAPSGNWKPQREAVLRISSGSWTAARETPEKGREL